MNVNGEKYRSEYDFPNEEIIERSTLHLPATSHTAVPTVEYLKKNVLQLFPPDFGPSSSLNLNPLDYGIWSALKQN